MNTFQIAAAAYGIACAAACALFHRFIRDAIRTMRRPSEAERVTAARERVGMPAEDTYDGPDSLRLLEDLEAHMNAYGAAVADLYVPAAIDDEQNGGQP